MLALVAYSLKPVNLLGPCKRTQQVPTTADIVGCCWPTMLRPFAWALIIVIIVIIKAIAIATVIVIVIEIVIVIAVVTYI